MTSGAYTAPTREEDTFNQPTFAEPSQVSSTAVRLLSVCDPEATQAVADSPAHKLATYYTLPHTGKPLPGNGADPAVAQPLTRPHASLHHPRFEHDMIGGVRRGGPSTHGHFPSALPLRAPLASVAWPPPPYPPTPVPSGACPCVASPGRRRLRRPRHRGTPRATRHAARVVTLSHFVRRGACVAHGVRFPYLGAERQAQTVPSLAYGTTGTPR